MYFRYVFMLYARFFFFLLLLVDAYNAKRNIYFNTNIIKIRYRVLFLNRSDVQTSPCPKSRRQHPTIKLYLLNHPI